MHKTKIKIAEDALDANTTIAQANRADFDRAGVRVINMMSAPGAGKTSLLERVLHDLDGIRVAVLEGDVQGSLDADRLASLHVPVTQINTDPGFGGECHLDANMVRSAIPALPLDEVDLLVIENVGNLVCPAEFKVGEDARVMVASVTEGEDKPLKYPLMFRTCEMVLVNKIDLLPHLDFDLDRFLHNIEKVNPGAECLLVSARTGEGVRGMARVAGAGGRARRGAGMTPGRRARSTAHRPPRAGKRGVLHRGGRADREALPQDGGALCPWRAADRARHLSGSTLGCPTRRGGVRAPRDRRQARAARDRVVDGAGPEQIAEPDDMVLVFDPDEDAVETAARHGCLTIGICPHVEAEWTFVPPTDDPFVAQELVETAVPPAVGAGARVLRPPRAPGGAHRESRSRPGSVQLSLSLPGRARGRPRQRAGRRAPLRADEGRRGGGAARADAHRGHGRARGGGDRPPRHLRRRRQAAGPRQRRVRDGRHGRGGGLPLAPARRWPRDGRSTSPRTPRS